MAKDNYNIDAILSEVKKRREENEKEIKERDAVKAPPAEEPSPAEAETDAPAEAPEEETAADVPEDEPKNEMVDILELSEERIEQTEEPQEEPKKGVSKKTKRTLIGVAIALVVLLVIAGITAYAVANNWLDQIVKNSGDNTVATTESQWAGMDKLVESFDPIEETEATQLSSLQDMIKTWYYNGAPCSSTHVLNVLLVGEDTRGKDILDDATRADTAIIASVNIDTKTITLTSILRDAYTYWETTEGDEATGQFGKINGAMSTGDINAYINCIEHMYKIDIDNYAIVNFTSFETIIDTLYSDGITLELTQKEINEINNHPKRYGNVTIEKTFEGTKGEVKLDGKQALAYCRIRKIDSDNARADRQKTTLMQVFKDVKKASTAKQLSLIKTLVPYIKTSFGKNEIVKIAKYAMSQGWLNFDIDSQNLPDYRLKGGTNYGTWCWRADFPADAYNLQMKLYGKSSITLAHIRVDTQKCPETGFFQNGARAMYTTITNDHYGEVTTITTTKKEDSE